MKKFDTIRWGIIGVGNVTEVKSGPAFYKTEHSRLVAVMRRNAEKAADYAKRHHVPKWYTDAALLINDEEVDAVYIATPPDTHALYAIQAMKAGKPVYVEKPMALSYTECLEMLRVSEQTRMPLWVAYYRRTLPAFLKVKELIETGAIGKVLVVNIRLHKPKPERFQQPEEMHWHVNPDIGGGGYFFDLASHQFDYLDFVFGPVTEVSGIAANRGAFYRAEDTVTASWKHQSGVMGTGSWCFSGDESTDTDAITVTGDKGEIVLPCFSHQHVKIKTTNGTSEMAFSNPEHISQYLVKQVVDELRGYGKCVSTGVSATRTSRVLDEVVKDYYKTK